MMQRGFLTICSLALIVNLECLEDQAQESGVLVLKLRDLLSEHEGFEVSLVLPEA